MVAQKKKKHKRIFVVRFVCTSVLLMLATVLLFFTPIFTIDTTSNTVLHESISTIVEIAKTEAPEIYSDLEVPERISMSPRETIRVVFQLNSTVSIIQKIQKGSLKSGDGVYPILSENIQEGNVHNVIRNLTVFSGFLQGSIFDKIISVSIVLYGLVHILIMFFVFWSVVYQPLKFLIVRFLIRQPSASFEDFAQRYIGTLLLLVKYSVFSFCF
ncbi:MAG: hypothetical protein IJD35_02880, partial [Clostridia bacterium]|nr:hypothetical protein [Clostridia bacterium]